MEHPECYSMQGLITLAGSAAVLEQTSTSNPSYSRPSRPTFHALPTSSVASDPEYPSHGGECSTHELPFRDSIPDGTEIVIRMSPFTIRDLIV